jgi:hypothetical protein
MDHHAWHWRLLPIVAARWVLSGGAAPALTLVG